MSPVIAALALLKTRKLSAQYTQVVSKHVREGEVIFSDNRFARLPDKESPLFIKNAMC
jgi:hypothetical protein